MRNHPAYQNGIKLKGRQFGANYGLRGSDSNDSGSERSPSVGLDTKSSLGEEINSKPKENGTFHMRQKSIPVGRVNYQAGATG